MKLALLILLVPVVAAAQPVTMTAGSHGSALDLTFTNTSKKSVTWTTHVHADLDHYDWLVVKLTGKTTRTMRFIESRDKSAPVDVTLAPGKSVTKSIDLAFWALHADNGDVLAPDTYEVEATWDTGGGPGSSPKQKLVARTKLTIAAPVEKDCKDTSKKSGIELLARQIGTTGTTIEVGLHNVDAKAHCVLARVDTHETQSDWHALTFDEKPTDKMFRKIVFTGPRRGSVAVTVELAPGATVWTRWDVAAWAKRGSGKALPSNTGVWATAIYDSTNEKNAWSGAINTSFALKFP